MIEFLLRYKEVIVLFASIGTFISALIAIFTLLEVKKQRLSIYKPDILIKSFTVTISQSPLVERKENLLKYKVSDFNDYSTNYNTIPFEVIAKYKVDNLGFGVAKNIQCTWQFNYSKAINMIQKIFPSNYSFNYHEDLNLYFLKDSNNDDLHYSSYTKLTEQNIDFISPINVQKHYHFHSIPEIIYYTHLLFLLFKNNLITDECTNFGTFEFKDFPKPILKIEYRDINNKKYTKRFIFKMSSVSTQIEDKLDLTKEFGYLLFEIENT